MARRSPICARPRVVLAVLAVLPQLAAAQSAAVLVRASDVSGAIDVRSLGAAGDGVTDDSGALQEAVDAAALAGGGLVWIPPGTYLLATRLVVPASNVHLLGAGRNATVLRRASGADMPSLLHLGPTDGGPVRLENCSVRGLRLDGAGGCGDAVLSCWNNLFCVLEDLQLANGGHHGLLTAGHPGEDNPRNQGNTFRDLEARANQGDGLHFTGEKNGRFAELYAESNEANGIVWEAFTGPGVAESTQNVAGNIIASTNGTQPAEHAGIVLDGVAKFSASGLTSTNNAGAGLRFESTHDVPGDPLAGANSGLFSSTVLRNNAGGGIVTAPGAFVIGVGFAGLDVLDSGGATDIVAVDLRGWQRCRFTNLRVESVAGTAVRLRDGTDTSGGWQPCANLDFTNVLLLANGSPAAGTSDGLAILEGSRDISFVNLFAADSHTSGASAEVNVGPYVSNVRVAGVTLDAAADGHEWQIAPDALDQVQVTGASAAGGAAGLPAVAASDPLSLPVAGTVIAVGGAAGFDTLTPGAPGRVVTLVFEGALTVGTADNIALQRNEPFVTSGADTLTLCSDGIRWFEIARSVN